MKTTKNRLGVLGVLAVTCALGCGGSASDPPRTGDGGVSGDTGGAATPRGNIDTICSRSRSQGCTTSSTCESELAATLFGAPATCQTLIEGYLSCAARSQGSTCAMIGDGVFAGCQSMMTPIESCVASNSGDASTAPTLPTPSELTAPTDVALSFERAGMTTQMTEGSAYFGTPPTGAPAGGQQFVFTSEAFPGGSSRANCTVGFSFANGQYTFNNNAVLTQPCEIRAFDDTVSTLTFTGARFSLAPAGNLLVRIEATLSGALGAGPVTVQVTYPPR
ncbi:MAG: hypothetical protein Q8S73_29300 [Deltaproteobacteria bacterium]|nr:hypothetical protein [Myxococcales bacterium]MDP3218239.1 hypothetical protein [Deltaproteobacteria bacterium]